MSKAQLISIAVLKIWRKRGFVATQADVTEWLKGQDVSALERAMNKGTLGKRDPRMEPKG